MADIFIILTIGILLEIVTKFINSYGTIFCLAGCHRNTFS
jgi:hypothetical protein